MAAPKSGKGKFMPVAILSTADAHQSGPVGTLH